MNLSTYLVSFTEVESQSYLHTIDKGSDVTTSLLFAVSSSCNHALTQCFPCSHSYLSPFVDFIVLVFQRVY